MMKNTISMNVSAIGTDDGKSTFEVQRTWNEKGKKAIAIGMYPTISVENCGMLDVSNMHLLNHANDFGWGELRMLNLYATVVNGKPSVSQLQGNWSYVKKKYKLNVPNFHVPAGQVSLQEPQQILPLLSDILLRTD